MTIIVRPSRLRSPEAPSLPTRPEPGRYYTIRRGDGGLLATTSRAYGVGPGGRRLALAQHINRHPRNRKFWVPPSSAFNRKYFPHGIISFNPRFGCGTRPGDRSAGRGRCFATIWIPPARLRLHARLGPFLSTPPVLSRGEAGSTMSLNELEDLLVDQCAAVHNPNDLCLTTDRDRRHFMSYTRGIPYRWACKLIVQYGDEKTWTAASGVLFGDRHLVTSAHVLTDRVEIGDGTKRRVQISGATRLIVIPVMNGLPLDLSPPDRDAMPFGAFEVRKWRREKRRRVANFRVCPEYLSAVRADPSVDYANQVRHDYGIVDISQKRTLVAGSPIRGNWDATKRSKAVAIPADVGSTKDIRHLLLAAKRKERGVSIAGYPADNPCSMGVARNCEMIRFAWPNSAPHNELQHFGDNTRGMSGGPVWLTQSRRSGGRTKVRHWLVGISTGCTSMELSADGAAVRYNRPARTRDTDLFNRVTLITPEVLERLRDPSLLEAVP